MGNHYTDNDADPFNTLDEFTRGYVAALLFSEHVDTADESSGQSFLDANYTADDLAPTALKSIQADCDAFLESNAVDVEGYGEAAAGNDFLFTRNGHGVGFWENDHGTPESCKRLDDCAHAYGETYAYLGDDDLIHVS